MSEFLHAVLPFDRALVFFITRSWFSSLLGQFLPVKVLREFIVCAEVAGSHVITLLPLYKQSAATNVGIVATV